MNFTLAVNREQSTPTSTAARLDSLLYPGASHHKYLISVQTHPLLIGEIKDEMMKDTHMQLFVN